MIQFAVLQYTSLNSNLTYSKLINGYRRFDPSRGMEYELDLQFFDHASNGHILKRCSLVRPLSKVEIVPMPYVTENSRLNLVLPVNPTDRTNVIAFLDNYAHTCLDTGDNVNLYVVFVYPPQKKVDPAGTESEDVFSALKSMISYYETKYMNGARISWVSLQNGESDEFAVMDAVTKRLMADSLVLLCSVNMDLSIDYLNRVRMNTINHWQAYFPISFWKYKSNYGEEAKPGARFDLNKNTGHFDTNDYTHPSFYTGDYLKARTSMLEDNSIKARLDLFDLFLKYNNINLFRAVEPSLLHDFESRTCAESDTNCLIQQAEGLASKSQLAKAVFNYQQEPTS